MNDPEDPRVPPPPRRRGRPPAAEPTEPLTIRLPRRQYDELATRARRERMPLATLVGRVLVMMLGPRS